MLPNSYLLRKTAVFYSPIIIIVMLLGSSSSVEATWPTIVVIYEDRQYHVVHLTEGGGRVTNITANEYTIKITMQSSQDARVQLAIPKDLLDATHISYDRNGYVPGIFVDEVISEDYTAELRDTDIIYTIPFEADTEEIEIVGAAPVPGLPQLIITEVELSSMNGTQWFELFNSRNITFSVSIVFNQANSFKEVEFDPVMFHPYDYQVFQVRDEHQQNEKRFEQENVVLRLLINNAEAHRTTSLTDSYADSRTWQMNDTGWVFEEETPTRVIPEFGSAIALLITAIFVSTLLVLTQKYPRQTKE